MRAMKTQPLHTTLQACLWMTGAIAAFSTMAIAGRTVSTGLDTFEIMLFRSLIGVVVVVLVARIAGTQGQIRPRALPLHMTRNVFHFAGQNFWFYSIAVLPLAQVFALEFTTPFWVMLLAPLVLGEALTKNRLLAAAVGFVGILIVTRPTPDSLSFGQLTAVLAAVGFAGSAVFTRRLTQTEGITAILFWLTVFQSLFGLICAGYDGDITLPSAQHWPLVALIALCGLVAHFCLTKALSLAPASVVMPVDFARLPIIAILGAMIYAEEINLYVLIGALVIFLANYCNIRYETKG